jgi:hypothetical protein
MTLARGGCAKGLVYKTNTIIRRDPPNSDL